jgi:hypothetical protein
MLNVIIQNAVVLNIVMQNAVMLNVIMQNVMTPQKQTVVFKARH